MIRDGKNIVAIYNELVWTINCIYIFVCVYFKSSGGVCNYINGTLWLSVLHANLFINNS